MRSIYCNVPSVLVLWLVVLNLVNCSSIFKKVALKNETNTMESKSFASLSVDELKLPDHLIGVKIERDGHLNKNFRQEVILGRRDSLEIKKKNPEKLLKRIFIR